MKTVIRAIVFRTPCLKETGKFFSDTLGLPLMESSPTHFLLFTKGIRIVFMETKGDPKVEIYMTGKPVGQFCILEDPNKVRVIISKK